MFKLEKNKIYILDENVIVKYLVFSKGNSVLYEYLTEKIMKYTKKLV